MLPLHFVRLGSRVLWYELPVAKQRALPQETTLAQLLLLYRVISSSRRVRLFPVQLPLQGWDLPALRYPVQLLEHLELQVSALVQYVVVTRRAAMYGSVPMPHPQARWPWMWTISTQRIWP